MPLEITSTLNLIPVFSVVMLVEITSTSYQFSLVMLLEITSTSWQFSLVMVFEITSAPYQFSLEMLFDDINLIPVSSSDVT